jgi:signal transduction histidine kinase
MDRPKIYSPSTSAEDSETRTGQPAAPPENAHLPMHGRKPQLTWVDVRQVVDEVCAQFEKPFDAAQIETTIDVPPELGTMADRDLLRQAIANLVRNALEAMPRGGRLVITSYCGERGLELEVADSGPGLSTDALRRAFEPFYTTKGNGAGLGLANVRRVAQAHGGDVVAMNCPEGGAAFTLRFPPPARRIAA